MINIRSLLKLKNDDGLTLKKGKKINYKSGWQVGTEGIETTDARRAMQAVKLFGGNCGIWYNNGIYYIDRSSRIPTKTKAIKLARECNQLSIYGWKKNNLVWR